MRVCLLDDVGQGLVTAVAAGDVVEEMRLQQIATFDEVRWAILESNGTISFVKKAS